jgi:hypothetical protein
MISRGATSFILVTLFAAIAAAQEPEPITVRAHRLTQPLVFDGRLDDAAYHANEPAPAFKQQEPRVGELATEQTEMWVFFDDRNVYVSARMHDSAPDRMVADEMRRDASIYQNEHFVVVFDTFHDRRTGFFFQTNPLGAVRDALIVDENNANYDWNAVWDVKVHRDETGWTSEMVIPFKSLRYPTGQDQVWGINARRWERRINEHSLLSITPPGTPPNNSVQRLANAATLVGIEVPPPARNIELKPYGVSNLTTNRVSSPPTSNKIDKDIGLDAKYGITSNVTLDLTVNTDFAQVEIDEQQVNLTRFSLFFPEKREFFLEGQGIFDFANTGNNNFNRPDVPIMFFSRRIGLDGRAAGPDQRWRAADWPCRPDLGWVPRHRDRRTVVHPARNNTGDELPGRARQAGHLSGEAVSASSPRAAARVSRQTRQLSTVSRQPAHRDRTNCSASTPTGTSSKTSRAVLTTRGRQRPG